NTAEVQKHLDAAGKTLTTAQEKEVFGHLQADLKAAREARAKVLELSRTSNDSAAAYDLNKQTVVPVAAKVAEDVKQLFDLKLGYAQSRESSIRASASKSRTTAIIVLLLAIAIGFGVALFLSGRIQKGVKEILDRLSMLREHCTTDLRNALSA